jgi:predicted CxxxxCH...CXXCH cytochrome family protein
MEPALPFPPLRTMSPASRWSLRFLVTTAMLAAGCVAQIEGGNVPDDAGAPPGGGAADAGERFDPSCGSCHGDGTSPAPPRNLAGDTDRTARGVGAHRSHVLGDTTWHRTVVCADCHAVPSAVGDSGHIDGDGQAELTFSALARSDGASPRFDGASCSNAYCHGATLPGGTLTQPTFTAVDGAASACGSCHGVPPPAPHPAATDCSGCHPTMAPGMRFIAPERHINGIVDLNGGGPGAAACDSCHGSDGVAAPPRDLDGNTDRTSPGVGAHRAHLGASDWHREITCSNCHVEPTAVDAPGHIDGDGQAEVPFNPLNASATYTPATATCGNLYCHGNGRASTGTMVWTQAQTLGCTSCHGVTGGTLSGRHGTHFAEGFECVECHRDVVDRGRTIIGPARHVDGARDVSIARGGTFDPAQRRCTNLACHGAENW